MGFNALSNRCQSIHLSLRQGACPRLKQLGLRDTTQVVEAGKMLATDIGSGYLGQHLEELDLSHSNLGHMGFAMMMRERSLVVFSTPFAARWINPEAPLPYPSGLRLT